MVEELGRHLANYANVIIALGVLAAGLAAGSAAWWRWIGCPVWRRVHAALGIIERELAPNGDEGMPPNGTRTVREAVLELEANFAAHDEAGSKRVGALETRFDAHDARHDAEAAGE